MTSKLPFLITVERDLEQNRSKTIKHLLKYYGNTAFFREHRLQGYSTVRFGSGLWFHMDLQPEKFQLLCETTKLDSCWSEAVRMMAVWIFIHPNGKMITFINLKLDINGWHCPGPKVTTYLQNNDELEKFLADFGIELLSETFETKELI
jgi:hypothetical protein